MLLYRLDRLHHLENLRKKGSDDFVEEIEEEDVVLSVGAVVLETIDVAAARISRIPVVGRYIQLRYEAEFLSELTKIVASAWGLTWNPLW